MLTTPDVSALDRQLHLVNFNDVISRPTNCLSPFDKLAGQGELAFSLGAGTQANVNRRESYGGILRSTLAKIKHLDLTERVFFDDNTKLLSGGGYGDIRVGACDVVGRGRVRVAVKSIRLYLQQMPEMTKVWSHQLGLMNRGNLTCGIQLLEREIRVWSRLRHINVLPLLGYAIQDSGLPSLISEFMDNGTVLRYVQKVQNQDVFRLVISY